MTLYLTIGGAYHERIDALGPSVQTKKAIGWRNFTHTANFGGIECANGVTMGCLYLFASNACKCVLWPCGERENIDDLATVKISVDSTHEMYSHQINLMLSEIA